MATKLTYEKLCEICSARSTKYVWFKNTKYGFKVSLKYNDAGHSMEVTIGGVISIGFDKCKETAFIDGIVALYMKDVYIGVLDIRDLEVWE